jgi:phosphoadenosine phosphosulfate reductase
MLTKEEIAGIEKLSIPDGIKALTEKYPGQVVFSTSLGQEDQVITQLIGANQLLVRIFTLDTGRLFNESYELMEKTAARYKTPIEIFFPEASDVQQYVNNKGVNGFYESVENRKECCFIRKVKPLNKALEGAKVWITGLRADQSDNRKDMHTIEWDEQRQLYKYNPLLNWSFDKLIDYIKQNNVPYNPLHDKGFVSIGCSPCTRAIEPGEDIRAGRWWWELSKKECGLHTSNP